MADSVDKDRPLGYWTALSPEVILMIMEYLPAKSLLGMCLSHKILMYFASEILYRHDAKYGNSTAILWAAFASGYDGPEELAREVFKASIHFHGNVNAVHRSGESCITALHVATEQGSHSFVKLLLHHGADISARCYRLYSYRLRWNMSYRATRSSTESLLNTESFDRYDCLPLLLPVLGEDWALVKLLIRHGSPGYIALGRACSFLSSDVITIIHAAIRHHLFQKNLNALIKKYPCCLNKQMPPDNTTALMMAIRTDNEQAFAALIEAGADSDIADALEISPLEEVIHSTMNSVGNPRIRAWFGRLTTILLENGASPNTGGNSSPLAVALSFAEHDWMFQGRSMTIEIDSLLEHGANPDTVMTNGWTAAQHTLDLIMKQNGCKSLESILDKLIRHGASIHGRYPNQKSMLLRVLESETDMKRVASLLLRHGATVLHGEEDNALKSWILHRTAWTSDFSIESCLQRVSNEAVNWAYGYVLDNGVQDAMMFNWLAERCQPTSVPSDVVARAFLKNSPKLVQGTLTALSFDAHWTDDQGRGFLHLVVINLKMHGRYKEKTALWDTRNLITGGISFFQHDISGKTALGYLMDLDTPYLELENLFHRQRTKQRGEIF